ncbi:MAG: PEGA domain-containing protein [Verrucomicrobia bacterium]|nr:PEGA domain-containing protein [Verrucomicrobiota bacterium]
MHRVLRFLRNVLPSLTASILLAVIGCASHTPVDRTRKEVRIISVPPGARIQVNGRYVGDAPVTVSIEMSQTGRFWRDTIIQADPQGNGYTQIRAFNGASRWSISDAVPSEIDFDTRTEPGAGIDQHH